MLKQWVRSMVPGAAVTAAVTVLTVLVSNLALHPVIVQQTSMSPSLEAGQRLFVNLLAYGSVHPGRGDVIVFQEPGSDPDAFLIKRVVGLPGETISIRSGAVYVDGRRIEEPYVGHSSRISNAEFGPYVIPEHDYFVLGDNRAHSLDSRGGWTVPRDSIMGRAWVSVWPLAKWGLSPNYSFAEAPDDSVETLVVAAIPQH